MFKKLAFPAIASMAMMLLFAPSPASARVRFGVAVGPAPVYAAPPVYANPYSYPAYPDYYGYPAPAYPYAYSYGPAYVPYSGLGFSVGGGHYDRGWGHADYGHGGHEFRGHEGHGGRR